MGRIFDLSIVAYYFDSYDELSCHADCKYAFDVNWALSSLTRRVESLNVAGNMLWPEPVPSDFNAFPVSRYEWLNVASDVFLMRYVSVVDCALLLSNEVFEVGLERHKCTIENLKKRRIPEEVVSLFVKLRADQGALREERNARFHHGTERGFTLDDETFRMAALFERTAGGLHGRDRDGRRIDVERSFREGLVELQREFNPATRRLIRRLDHLYDQLGAEFETRFVPRFRAGEFGRKRREV